MSLYSGKYINAGNRKKAKKREGEKRSEKGRKEGKK
jgi:hypothetical protein